MNKFKLLFSSSLENQSSATLKEAADYNLELDTIVSLLHDICDVFEETNSILFQVEFGGESWPVSLGFDLPVLLEQLPAINKMLDDEVYEFELDFYEQGLQRKLIFQDKSDSVSIFCESGRHDWKPVVEEVIISTVDLKNLFRDFWEGFMNTANALCPNITSHSLFTDWKNTGKSE